MDILTDTYNLRLAKGTGIKTYGESLLAALGHLGASTRLLGDRPVAKSETPVLEEVQFFDVDTVETRWSRAMDWLAQVAYFGGARDARNIQTQFVLDELSPFGQRISELYSGIANVPKIYDRANRHFFLSRRMTRVRLNKPPSLWHATCPLPIKIEGVPMVTTIHDLIPLRLPFATLDNKKFFYRLVKACLAESDLILTVSENTKADVVSLYGVDEEKIEVTYQALPPQQPVDEATARAVLTARNLEPGRYLLFAGNIEPKKNLIALVQAAASMSDGLPLVVVGRKAWMWEQTIQAGEDFLGRRFVHLNYLPRDELAVLYSKAAATVFPSIYEGFGLPVLEAMQAGCPVLCSNVSSLPEVGGDAALYFNPREPADIRRQIHRVLGSERLRDKLREAGRERVDFFSLENYARRLQNAYARVL